MSKRDLPKIVIVDDVMFHLLSTKQRLKNKFTVLTAQTVEKLIDHLNNEAPELIILDILMPNKDGFEIIETLKSNPLYSDVPVIFLTSQKDKGSILKAMNLGAADYLIKPVSNTDLIKSINIFPRKLNHKRN